ncbi:MAG: InlB B-repeat-containing protein, partial [Bacteroidales bacterium]|nr:InlB B-repeat-containing protein [Bacteroidales bacterium]
MKHILRYTAALFCVVLALTACLPEEPVHETINMGAGELTSLSSSAASLMCEIEDELPKYSKIEYGIVYSDNREKVENHKGVKKIEGQGLSENRFTVQLADLKAKQEYFYCSYLRIDEGRIIYGDISSFVTKASYKASFDANGGKGGMEPQHFEEDDNKALTDNAFTREHHEFAGWNTKSDGSGSYYQPGLLYTLSEDVKLFAQWQAYSGMEEGYTYVDLGLSVEWATRNVGADRREAYGDYFAWGETQPKSNYAWETYQWGIASDLLTKYCIDAAHGKNGATDGKTVLELSDDAARVQWKGDWRMPTLAEQQELREKCSWKWKNLNGIAGYEVTGPSGKSIFLPAAGFKNNDALYQAGSYGCYWSSNLYEIQSDYAYYLNIIPSTHEQAQYSRSYGYSLRPVYTTYYCMRFDANGGTGKMDSMMVKKTETATLPVNTFTRDGYFFTSWNTAPDGSGTKVAVQSKFSPTSDTTFYAQWHKVWMLHFDANGGKYNGSGTTMPDQQFKDGEAQEIEANVFTREKHKFVCWNTKADGSGDSIVNQQEVLLTSDTTLYAQWHKLYTITFHANGGSGSATTFNQTFEEGVSRQLLNNLFSRTYYVFTGWNTKADGSGVSYDDKATITATSDMDLYAQWKAVYKLTFNGNGATSNMAPQTFYAGEAQQINKNTITRSGYKFMAWNTKVDGSGTSYRDGEIITLKSNMTLFAQWQVVSGTAQGYDYVDLGLPSGTKWATCNVGATQPYEYGDYFAWGETVTKKSYAWNNYKHGQRDLLTKYCYDIDEGKDDFVDYLNMLLSVDDVASFKWGANWRMPLESEIKELIEKCTWTWTWNALVGVKGYMVKGSNGNTIFLPAAGSYDGNELFEKDREAYYWTGSLQSSGNSNAACALSFSATERHANLYARAYGHSVRPVLSLEYSIFFDANGGTGTMSVQKVQKGASLNLKSNAFTKDGYVFTGWNTRADGEGRSYANLATMIPMENMQLYAQWHPLVYVFLNPNGGTGTQVKQTLKKDVETSLSENPFTRKGYVFDSWNTKADGTGTSYADKASITLSKDLQLYAQWKKEGYTITFNANGGKGEMKSMQFVYSENQTLPQNTYTRESAIFVGWNTKADGTGVSYADGMSCTFEANTTLYAQWLVISGNQDGKDYVDLGLSVQWAVYNIGAERPEQYGDHFAWGETQPKEAYSWTNYAHGT